MQLYTYPFLRNHNIRTKGDANDDSMPDIDYPIREQNYIGKVVYTIPSSFISKETELVD